MKEIGGYLELEQFPLQMMHSMAIGLNCGRNALAYVIRARNIQKLKIPCFLCDAVDQVCRREKIHVSYYHIGPDFKPMNQKLEEDEWLYLVNFYGQISNQEIEGYKDRYSRIIVDHSHAYYQMPVKGVDTLYTCRKWFGVPDGAFLYTDHTLCEELSIEESSGRMSHLLGRYESNAADFYSVFSANEAYFESAPIRKMSRLTENLLHGINYDRIAYIRKLNFALLSKEFEKENLLKIKPSLFVYPLMIENGETVRKLLQSRKIYVPMLWPSALESNLLNIEEEQMVKNILPLPIDQRYGEIEMEYMIKEVRECIRISETRSC